MRRSLALLIVLMLLVGHGVAGADDEDDRRRERKAEEAGVSREAVSAAIDGGAQFLLRKYEGGFATKPWNSTVEFVMLTLAHAGVDESNEVFKKGLEALEKTKLQYTYRVAALAMALYEIDKVKYRARIAHCAQWLVDTQLKDGEWGYPRSLASPSETPKPVEVDPPEVDEELLRTGGGRYSEPLVTIKRGRPKNLDIRGEGDISNTQFAILGLKACQDARIKIPKTTWTKALAYMRKFQRKDGGWGYAYAGRQDDVSYASMTCAGVCSIALCREGLGKKNPQRHPCIKRGVAWLDTHFSLDGNHNIEVSHVADPTRWYYYYLYSIERVGQIIGIEQFGDTAWYPAGAGYLIESQKKNGSWWTGVPGQQWKQAGDIETADTCFAILFLTRSTPRLGKPVVTGGSK